MRIPDEPIKIDITDETFAGVTYHLRGALVPELQIEVSGQAVMFEHHTLLWKEHRSASSCASCRAAIKRKIAGLDFFITKTAGSGRIAFSRDWPGQCIPLHLAKGQEVNVREHHFLAATDNIDYSFERVKGVRNMLLGGSGMFIDKFHASDGDAVVWVSGQGNVFEIELGERRGDRRRGGRLALQGPERQARVALDRSQDGHVRRRPQAHLEPLHRSRQGRDPDDVHRTDRVRGRRQRGGGRRPAASRAR